MPPPAPAVTTSSMHRCRVSGKKKLISRRFGTAKWTVKLTHPSLAPFRSSYHHLPATSRSLCLIWKRPRKSLIPPSKPRQESSAPRLHLRSTQRRNN
ncbi:hypothetical protein U9M48_033389 [Paspalum notatum var. saurae]|uniref:Uncharacterized protein n=1 Tax=Paspalum notatum var. saurae TaxID=547442 RepID=A0AAQ3X5H7_PASNO